MSTRFPLALGTLPDASRTALAWRSDDDTDRRTPDEPLNATFSPFWGELASPGLRSDSRRRGRVVWVWERQIG